jgi:hypothetical protein
MGVGQLSVKGSPIPRGGNMNTSVFMQAPDFPYRKPFTVCKKKIPSINAILFLLRINE